MNIVCMYKGYAESIMCQDCMCRLNFSMVVLKSHQSHMYYQGAVFVMCAVDRILHNLMSRKKSSVLVTSLPLLFILLSSSFHLLGFLFFFSSLPNFSSPPSFFLPASSLFAPRLLFSLPYLPYPKWQRCPAGPNRPSVLGSCSWTGQSSREGRESPGKVF